MPRDAVFPRYRSPVTVIARYLNCPLSPVTVIARYHYRRYRYRRYRYLPVITA